MSTHPPPPRTSADEESRFGDLRPSNVPALIQHILSTQPHELTHAKDPVPPPGELVEHWRGRMGLTREEQTELALKAKEEKEEDKDSEVGHLKLISS
jgi:hypothetical protein